MSAPFSSLGCRVLHIFMQRLSEGETKIVIRSRVPLVYVQISVTAAAGKVDLSDEWFEFAERRYGRNETHALVASRFGSETGVEGAGIVK